MSYSRPATPISSCCSPSKTNSCSTAAKRLLHVNSDDSIHTGILATSSGTSPASGVRDLGQFFHGVWEHASSTTLAGEECRGPPPTAAGSGRVGAEDDGGPLIRDDEPASWHDVVDTDGNSP